MIVALVFGVMIVPRAFAQVDSSAAARDTVGRTTTTPRTPLSPLDASFPFGAYKHTIQFDSASGDVRLEESVFGLGYGQPQTLSLEEFLAQRQHAQERSLWEKRGADYKLSDAPSGEPKDALERIIGSGTNFEIPIPQNPIFSIFGAPTVSINVNASVVLSAGWQWDNNNLTTIGSLGSTQSAPFFQQNIQVSASGKVGDKLKLNADFDNGRQFDFDNQLKIAFGGGPGSDDDIIQDVEAGNVQLQTPSTLIGGSQTLFGIKSAFKFGPLNLTAIASQKRGEKKTVTVSGGSVKTTIAIKPYEYAQNHFWLDTVYTRFWDEYYASPVPTATPDMQPYSITDIEVYEQVKDASIPAQIQAVAIDTLPAITANQRYAPVYRYPSVTVSGSVQLGAFRRLDAGSGYDVDRLLGTVTIRSLQQDKMYAVAYRTQDGHSYGELSTARSDTSRTVLKLIYVNNMQPTFRILWARQMKNIYQLSGVRNIDLQNSTIKITYGVPPDTSEVLKVGGSPRLVTVLGVDRYNSSNELKADGDFDIHSPYFFDPAKGEIIFPSSEPFRKGLRSSPLLGGDAENYVINAIYDRPREEARRDERASRYTIDGEIAGAGGNKIPLGTGWGVPPTSIRVIANGQPLQENIDYRVDPVFGEVTLISARANNSTGNIVVEYEQNDFLTTSVKTLLGLRADYDLMHKRYTKAKLGMTLMRYEQSLQTEKVQIYSGDEPTMNVMLGFDGSVEHQAGWLTKAIDALPLIDTKEMSTLSLQGEWALVMPNPNTKASLVSSDLGKGAAYIDDFESGAKRQIQLSTSYSYWHPSSAPVDPMIGFNDSNRLAHKGHFFWYNHIPANTATTDIWPNRDVAQGAQKTTVLDLAFNPERRGMYNMNFPYEQGAVSRDSVWGGMMRSLSFYTTNLDEENIDYIEVTMQVEGYDPRMKMYMDLGQISEDVIPDQKINTEDGITPTNPQLDDILNQGEDVGIDAMNNDSERVRYQSSEPDPSRDDYFFNAPGSDNETDYENVNGLENNVGPERGPYPDTEDLNGNRGLDLDNTYFNYEINLDPNPATNPQIVGGGNNPNGWRQYRIPIRTGYRAVGSPSFANVQFARIWFKSPVHMHVRIAEMSLVGSDWRNLNTPVVDVTTGDAARDPKLDIAFVNLVDNSGPPEFYTIPPGVQQEREYSTDVLKNEQSLTIRVKDLARGESRGAIRVRPRPFDVFNYKQMKFFLHGGGDMDDQPTPGQAPKVIAFMRFGWDSLNYYEYRVPLLRGWNEYTVNFGDLAAIKGQAPNPDGFAVPGQPGNKFFIKGIPSLTRVQFIAFGIVNNAYPGSLSTTMWVDELRATSAEDASDWAATLAANAKLADLGTLNYNVKRVNPNFHQLEERFGNRVEATNWAFNSDFRMEKFLPNAFKGSSLPLVYKHSEKIEKPRYVSESDVEVDAAVRQIGEQATNPDSARKQADSLRNATETLVVQDGFALSNIKINFPGENWMVKDLLNRLTFGYTYDQTRERSPIVEQRFTWQWVFQGRYAVDIPRKYDLQPLTFLASVPVLNFWKDFRINFLPSQLSAGTSFTRGRTTEQLRNIPEPSPVVRDFHATRNAQFNWQMTEGGIVNLTTDYSVDATSSLAHLETDLMGIQRTGGEIAKEIFLKEGRLFNFGLDQDLNQKITFNTRPRIPFIPNAESYLTPSANYTVRYHWHDDLVPVTAGRVGGYTKSADWTSNATLGLDVRLASIGTAIFGNDRAADSAGVITKILRYLIKVPLLDFQTVRFSFTEANRSNNPGIVGSTGVSNLWGRSLLFRSESPDFGPGTAYQLGLTSDPNGTLTFHPSSRFPFVDVTSEQGIRAPNIFAPNSFTQNNSLTATTDRDLWTDARLTLNWNLEWGYNKDYFVTTDGNGVVQEISNPRTTGKISRTYLSLPSFFGIDPFGNDIEGIANAYIRQRSSELGPAPSGPGTDSALNVYNRKLTALTARIFEQQLEALNWLPGNLARYLPRVNWRFTWNNLQKLPFFSSWASSVSVRHEYKSQYTENYRITDEGEIPESQTVSRGFSPLIQINVTGLPDYWKGTMSGSITYRTTSDFSLITSDRSEVSKELKNDLELQFAYQKRGLSLPLFGLNLKNDVEFQLNFTYGRTNRKRFDLTNFQPEGNNDGSTRISCRPQFRYTLSNTVQASAFVSYEATIPDAAGSRDISRSTTRVGLDLRIGISGGR